MVLDEQAFNDAMNSAGDFGVDGDTGKIVSPEDMARKWRAIIEGVYTSAPKKNRGSNISRVRKPRRTP